MFHEAVTGQRNKLSFWFPSCERELLPVLLQSSDIARLLPSSDLLKT